jgi:hypothetical protein
VNFATAILHAVAGFSPLNTSAGVSPSGSLKTSTIPYWRSPPTELRWLGNVHNGPVPSGTRFALMPNEQVLKHGVDAVVFPAVQFSIFVK